MGFPITQVWERPIEYLVGGGRWGGWGGGVGFHQKSAGVRLIIVAKRCEKRHGVFTLIKSARGNRKFF